MATNHQDCGGNDNRTVAGELQIAERVISEGDLPHAAYHVATALHAEPGNQEAVALTRKLFELSSDPFSLQPIGEECFFGIGVLHSLFLEMAGRYNEAVGYCGELHSKSGGDLVFLERGMAICRQHAESVQESGAYALLKGGAFVVVNSQDRRIHEIHRDLARMALSRQETWWDNHHALVGLGFLLRRCDFIDEALAWSTRAHHLSPSSSSALGIAYVWNERGDWAEGLRWLQIAFELDPTNGMILMDIGDALSRLNRWPEAVDMYDRAAKLEPDHPWPISSGLYGRVRLNNDESWACRQRLLDFAALHMGNQRVAYEAMIVQPWILYLPVPSEATVALLKERESSYSYTLASWEGPSCGLTLRLKARQQGVDPATITVKPGKPGSPDPRVSRSQKEFELWTCRSPSGLAAVARTELPPPDTAVAQKVAELAATEYRLSIWYRNGRLLAGKLQTKAVRDLMACMVHPPSGPDRIPVWEWVQRVQFVSCCLLASLDKNWLSSPRARILISILRGPMDWATCAAAIVLSQHALECPALHPEIAAALWGQLKARPLDQHCCYTSAICVALLRLNGHTPTQLKELQQLAMR